MYGGLADRTDGGPGVRGARLIRLVCTTLTALAVNDGLQLAYDNAKDAGDDS